jgi:hypothetical protein
MGDARKDADDEDARRTGAVASGSAATREGTARPGVPVQFWHSWNSEGNETGRSDTDKLVKRSNS